MLLLGLIPGLPKVPFFMIAALMAYLASRATVKTAEEVKTAEIVAEKKKADPQQQLEALLKLDEISLEVGYALVPLVDQAQGGQFYSVFALYANIWPSSWASSFPPCTLRTTSS